jgi:hypothetical protein
MPAIDQFTLAPFQGASLYGTNLPRVETRLKPWAESSCPFGTHAQLCAKPVHGSRAIPSPSPGNLTGRGRPSHIFGLALVLPGLRDDFSILDMDGVAGKNGNFRSKRVGYDNSRP